VFQFCQNENGSLRIENLMRFEKNRKNERGENHESESEIDDGKRRERSLHYCAVFQVPSNSRHGRTRIKVICYAEHYLQFFLSTETPSPPNPSRRV